MLGGSVVGGLQVLLRDTGSPQGEDKAAAVLSGLLLWTLLSMKSSPKGVFPRT